MVYDILNPSLAIIGAYLLTYGLHKGGLLGKRSHVNLWNFILLIGFMISGIGGFILLLSLENGINSPLNHQLLYWHVEAGIGLVLVTILHFHCYNGSIKRIVGVK